MENKLKVSCFGAGFVGLPTMSVLALYNPQADVVIVKFSLQFLTLMKKEYNHANKEKCQFMNPGLKKLSNKPMTKI